MERFWLFAAATRFLGSNWLMGDESVEGLSILDLKTVRAGAGFDRLIENIALESELSPQPVVGYETMPVVRSSARP